VVALADGLAVALADDCGNGVGSYPDHVQAASAATANAVNVAATGRWALICTPRCVGPDDQATLAKIATLWVLWFVRCRYRVQSRSSSPGVVLDGP
jgi:hypothetical protein